MGVIERPKLFTCLPRERYVSQEWFEREMEEVVLRQWIFFAHESQLPAPGDVLVREIGDESIVATRDQAGEVHAFFNVCRHRGYRICDPGPGSAKHIVCPYHRWSWGLDGSLSGAPTLRDGEDFEFADYGLNRVHVEVWCGLVFVALGAQPPASSVAAGLREAAAHVEPFAPERTKLAHHIDYEVECNWKVLMENFMECYHCRGSHPEFCATSDVPRLEESIDEITFDFMGREYNWGQFPLREGAKSFTLDGERACRLNLGTAGPETMSYGVSIQPTLTALAFVPGYAIVHQFAPITIDRTRWTAQWLVHADAVEGEDYEVEDLIAIWDATNRQDIELCERTQLGVKSRSFTPGPNSPTREPQIRSALAAYHRLLGEDDLYEELTGERP